MISKRHIVICWSFVCIVNISLFLYFYQNEYISVALTHFLKEEKRRGDVFSTDTEAGEVSKPVSSSGEVVSNGVYSSANSSSMSEEHLHMRACLINEASEIRLELFRKKLKEYTDFHRDQIELVRNGTIPASKVPTLTWSCSNSTFCSGVGDQFYRIEVALLLAMASNRVFGIQWDSVSMNTMKYLKPHTIRWDLVYGDRGIILDQRTLKDNESNLSCDNEMCANEKASRKSVSKFMNTVYNEDYVHISLTSQMYVPIDKGIKLILKWDNKTSGLFRKMGVLEKTEFNFDTLQHIILQYLFTFQDQLLNTVNQIQWRTGLTDPYVGIHLRTGFAGNEYEETFFNSYKVIRNRRLWKKILTCSIKRANSLIGVNSKLFLATDSYKVKKRAKRMYPDRIITLNIKLQHVAYTKSEGNPYRPDNLYWKAHQYKKVVNQSDPLSRLCNADVNMGTWIDFLLLSRSYAVVYSPFCGFSDAAKNMCLIPKSRVFHTTKNCKRISVKEILRYLH